MNKLTKVAIVGAGAVGTTTATLIAAKGLVSEVVLIDVNKDKAFGEVLDLAHSGEFHEKKVKLIAGDYSDCGDADIVVITVGTPFDGVYDRLAVLNKTANILKSVVPSVVNSGFNGIFLVVSNPCDCMAQIVKEISGFDKSKVIASGTILESARLRYNLGEILDINPKSIEAYVLGEHGDSMVSPWSQVRIAAKPIQELIAEKPEKYGKLDLAEISKNTITSAYSIFKAKGNTMHGVSASICEIICTILQDERKILPLSVYLEGEYGLNDVYCGVPVMLGKDGVSEIIEYNLTEEEMKALHASAKIIKENVDLIER